METIPHGIPKHNYFAIAQPPTPGAYSDKVGKEIVIKNPKTDDECKVLIEEIWRLKIKDIPDSFCKLTYGLNKAKLMAVLKNKYPLIETKQEVQFLLLKKID